MGTFCAVIYVGWKSNINSLDAVFASYSVDVTVRSRLASLNESTPLRLIAISTLSCASQAGDSKQWVPAEEEASTRKRMSTSLNLFAFSNSS